MKSDLSVDNTPKPFLRVKHTGEKAWAAADSKLAAIKNAAQLDRHKKLFRKKFKNVFGPMPDPDAEVPFRVLGKYAYRDIVIEQVILTSDLGYEISALTCVKKGLRGPLPGMIWASGHTEEAAWAEKYLKIALAAAMNGFYVVSFDPAGQGCRREIFHDDDDPVYWSPCKQHQSMGAPIMLIEDQLARFVARDCVTAVSFLSQRPEVDPKRIGFTGQSGGGLQVYMAMGADPRISAAVPQQATSSRRGAFKDIQMRDAEQTFYRCWPEGLDCHEMGALFAPKPLRIISEYGYFDQVDIYRKLLPVYTALGCEDKIEIASTGCTHGLSRSARENALQWLNRWLNPPTPLPVEPEWPGYARFRKTLGAQLSKTNLKNTSIIEYCRGQVEKYKPRRSGKAAAIKRVKHLKGVINKPGKLISTAGNPLKKPRLGTNLLELDANYAVPFEFITGKAKNNTTVIIADSAGRNSRWTKNIVRKTGPEVKAIIALDVFNCGEMKSNKPYRTEPYYIKNRKYYEPSVCHAFDAFMAGSSPVGLIMEEIQILLKTTGLDKDNLVFYGKGVPALGMLFLAALMPNVKECRLSGMPESYETLFDQGRLVVSYDYLVPDILRYTDIPLVVAELRKRGTTCCLNRGL